MKKSPFHPVYWPSWLVLGLLRLWVALPYPIIYYSGRGLGWLMEKTMKGRRHVVDVNIGLCFPELSATEQNTLVSKTMQSTALGLLEVVYSWWASDAAIKKRSRVARQQYISDTGSGRNKNLMVVTFHLHTL